MPTRKTKENPHLNAVLFDIEHMDNRRSKVPEEPERELGQRLARLRENRELSQEQLSTMTKAHDAAGVGISRAVISMYERGRNRPSTRELRILCDTLTVTPSELLYGSSAPFEIDKWQILNKNKSDAKYYARWLYLLADMDTTLQLAIYELVIGIVRPTQAQLTKLDANASALLLRLAKELPEDEAREAARHQPSPPSPDAPITQQKKPRATSSRKG